MKKLLFSILVFLTAGTLASQNQADSLWNIWNDQTQSDSLRVEAFSEFIARYQLKDNPDSAKVLIHQIEEFASLKKLAFAKANTLRLTGKALINKFEYAKSLKYLKKSLELSEEINYPTGQARATYLIGSVFRRQDKVGISMEYFEKCKQLYHEIGDSSNYALVLIEIGSIHKNTGKHDQALEKFGEAYSLLEGTGDDYYISNILSRMASIHRRQNNLERSLELNLQALQLRENINDRSSIASSYNNIGNLYEDFEDFEKALEYHYKALKIRKEIDNKYGIGSSLKNIGSNLRELNRSKEAINYCKTSLELFIETNTRKSRQYASCYCLYNAYKETGNDSKSLVYLEKMHEINEQIHKENNEKKLQEIEFERQIAADSLAQLEEKRVVALAHKEAIAVEESNRNKALLAFALSLIGAIAIFSRWRLVSKARKEIQKEKDRAESLLLNILPAEIADELKNTGAAEARDFAQVSVLFTDFKGFTSLSEKLSARDLVSELNTCFKAFDGIITKYGLEKIKTIGDAYMAAGGLPSPDPDAARKTVHAAIEMNEFILSRRIKLKEEGRMAFQMRLGIHTGPVVAGIVGIKKFQYDIWGDTVNTASRMESNGEVGRVNVSESTYQALKHLQEFSFNHRGKIVAKGKGAISMYFAERKDSESI